LLTHHQMLLISFSLKNNSFTTAISSDGKWQLAKVHIFVIFTISLLKNNRITFYRFT
jgi:hypothetical protein